MPKNDNGFDFENEILSFKSNINGFTKSIFKDFDSTVILESAGILISKVSSFCWLDALRYENS